LSSYYLNVLQMASFFMTYVSGFLAMFRKGEKDQKFHLVVFLICLSVVIWTLIVSITN
jgi:hypothetical protein